MTTCSPSQPSSSSSNDATARFDHTGLGTSRAMADFPLPGSAPAIVAVPAPGTGQGFWNGASSAALDEDGSFVVAYRLRMGTTAESPAATIVARSDDGENLA